VWNVLKRRDCPVLDSPGRAKLLLGRAKDGSQRRNCTGEDQELAAQAAPRTAKNVILFIGDAGGIPTLHAASVYKYDHPQKLCIQTMPHLALMDTSAADVWVTDSAAGMSAIVTGQKTLNGVIS
jgi:alkaline phosphatase